MREVKASEHSPIKMLASDMDGTFIPLADQPTNRTDLIKIEEIIKGKICLAYVTGRHLSSVQAAIKEYQLPIPSFIICNVGTELYREVDGDFVFVENYHHELESIISMYPKSHVISLLDKFDALQLQEEAKQGDFKTSYYCDQSLLSEVGEKTKEALRKENAPYEIISSVDPFNQDGLVDVLPTGVNKSFALHWLVKEEGLHPDEVIFCGDSGNDLAALAGGFRGVLVQNSPEQLVLEAKALLGAKFDTHFYKAKKQATSGVLEGLLFYQK